MKSTIDYEAAKAHIKEYERRRDAGLLGDEEDCLVESVMDAENTIRLYETVWSKLTEDELQQLFDAKNPRDIRHLNPIKEKHGLTWGDVRILIQWRQSY